MCAIKADADADVDRVVLFLKCPKEYGTSLSYIIVPRGFTAMHTLIMLTS